MRLWQAAMSGLHRTRPEPAAGGGRGKGRILIELKRLRQVVALADSGNFARAAQALHMSQPALSRSIQDLEKQLGAPLFERPPREIRPTSLGALIVEEGRELLRRAAALDAAIADHRGLSRTVVFGSGLYSNVTLVPRAIAAFAAQQPDVQVKVVAGGWRDCRDMLERGAMDFFIGERTDDETAEAYRERPLRERQGRVVVRKGHPLCALPACTLADIAQYPFAGARLPERIARHFPRKAKLGRPDAGGKLLVPRFEAYSWTAISAIVQDSDAVAFGSASLVAESGGALVCLDVVLPWLRYVGAVVWRAERGLSSSAQSFADVAIEIDATLPD